MAATASSDHHQIHLHKKPLNFRRRRHHTTVVVSPENSSWCCPSTVSSNKPQPSSDSPALRPKLESFSDSPEYSDKSLILKQSPASLEKSNMGTTYNHQETFPSSFSNFNSALTAGLLNPMSPPPSAADKARSSPTLFEMMANEPDCKTPNSNGNVSSYANPRKPNNNNNVNPSPGVNVIDRHALMQQRLLDLLSCRSPGSRFNEPNSSDVKLTLSSKDGMSVCMNAHRQILVSHSRFFAVKLSGWKGGQQAQPPYIVEISDCDDIEVYIESIRLMYCKDLRRKLMKEDVPRVLGILKVSAAIGFDAGVLSCLEYLEAAPWAEDEEEKVSSLLSELQLEGAGPIEVLKRVSVDFTSGVDESNNEVLLKLLHTVLEGKDEKARREMKVLVAKMLHENSSHNDLRKESLYSACDKCLILLKKHFLKASKGDLEDATQITRQADNLHFLLDILIDRQISEDFLKSWVSLTELSEVHSKVPPLHRYEISRVTARLFVGIGKGQLLASKDLRFLLLKTWLVPFYDDFAWMKRASRGLDRHLIEDGLGNTILTLSLTCQQEILMTWFDRFLNSSDDCPNIQRAFEVWWKRAFWKKGHQQPERPRQNESFRLS